jgi:hypothetical protein
VDARVPGRYAQVSGDEESAYVREIDKAVSEGGPHPVPAAASAATDAVSGDIPEAVTITAGSVGAAAQAPTLTALA